jgi:putative Mg2+ transporter-C (MgtC) family protein
VPQDLALQLDITLRLLVAALLGAVVGIEREVHGHQAGMRTHMLVSLGSAIFTVLSIYGFNAVPGSSNPDPTRIAAQVVTGIGFLGAGAILKFGTNIRGLTTAASLWLVAAIGMAAGAGFWMGAVIATVVALISLRPLEWMKGLALPQRVASSMVVVLKEDGTAGDVLDAIERAGDLLALRRDGKRLEVEVRIDRAQRSRALDEVAELQQVEEARWQN